MKTTLEWLKDFVSLNMTVKEFADGMTMSGSKVEGITSTAGQISRIVTGKVLSVEPHPDADRLVLCQLDIGSRTLQIVTGATNVTAGSLVPVVLDGGSLADGKVIRAGQLRGQNSDGMLCSVAELGYTPADFPDASADGIYILPPGTPVGADICQVLQLTDDVIDFEITSNRVDCFAVEGLAREAAATFDLAFSPGQPAVRADHPDHSSELADIRIEASDLCYRYCGRVIRDVQIGPSPAWMRRRLRGAGMRPINNLVDITNYVMLELGQPMHAFDLEQLAGRTIRVRRAVPGERMITLDSVARQLDPDMLVIADADRAVALAGVMGAENSEVTAGTRQVLLESATFNPVAVRQAARKVGLRTEASARFEKGLDINLALRAMDRACELIEKTGAGRVCQGTIDVWPVHPLPVTLTYTAAGINGLLGTRLDEAWLAACFARLGIEASPSGDGRSWLAAIPSWRSDLLCEADLAEEAARLFGYNNIEPSLLSGKQTTLGGRSPSQRTREKIKDLMQAAGFFEACTYSFESPKQLDRLMVPQEHELRRQIRIMNPLGEDYSVMRTSMVPAMLSIAATNWSRSVTAAQIFEMAYVYLPRSLPLTMLPQENGRLAAFSYDTGADDGSGSAFFAMKGILDEIVQHLGIEPLSCQADSQVPWLHPGRAASVSLGGATIGWLGYVHPDVAEAFAAPACTVLLDLALEPLLAAATEARRYQALPRFPAVTRDLALLVSRDVTAGQLVSLIKDAGGAWLEQVRLFDVYQGPQVAAGSKSLAFSLVFRAADRTLSDEAIAPLMDRILARVEVETGANRRA